jgi:hypothetical protein
MASFTVLGPVAIPTIVGRSGGRSVDRAGLANFWEATDCGRRVGCYVFGIRSGRGTLPYYAGRTTNAFENECFTADKLMKYHYVLTDIARGTPVMFFAVLDTIRGRPSESAVGALEERLIALGMQRNDRMANVSSTRKDDLMVRGVMGTGSGRGRRTVAASAFRSMIGL